MFDRLTARLRGETRRSVGPDPGYRHTYALMTMARWETNYIAEFVAYYRAIGFDHLYLYCNDDDPGDLYTEVAAYVEGPDPFVTFVHYPYQGQQWWMFLHFLRTYKDETEWIALFDVDEFLSLPSATGIHEFMKDRAEGADSIFFHWLYFGHNGFAEPAPGSVLRNYTRREPHLNANTKTMTRTAKIDLELQTDDVRRRPSYILPHHGWTPATSRDMRCRDVLGNDMEHYYGRPDSFERLYGAEGGTAEVRATAVLHHYAFKSLSAFQRRVDRGVNGEFQDQAIWKARLETGEHLPLLDYANLVEDTTLKRFWEKHLGARASIAAVQPPAGAPLASPGKPALQSSVDPSAGEDAANNARHAVSGAVTGRHSFCTLNEAEPWWQVDLQGPHTITEVRLYNRLDDLALAERASRFRLSVSLDGGAWRVVFVREDEPTFGGADGRPFRWIAPPGLAARFLRVTLLGSAPLHLDQVEVYGRPIDAPLG